LTAAGRRVKGEARRTARVPRGSEKQDRGHVEPSHARVIYSKSHLASVKVGEVTFCRFLNTLLDRELGKPAKISLPLAVWQGVFVADRGRPRLRVPSMPLGWAILAQLASCQRLIPPTRLAAAWHSGVPFRAILAQLASRQRLGPPSAFGRTGRAASCPFAATLSRTRPIP
jgi:hypothetical protein